jgi:3-hydroxybutyryl-CoA dehydrogenase
MTGVIGLGTMGAGIAEVFARAGLGVTAVEVDDNLLALGRERVTRSLRRAVDRGRLGQDEMDAILQRVAFTTDRSDLARADLVLEAVPERHEIKAAVFAELHEICPAHAVLATNTSSLPVTRLAAATGRPGRVVGMHFFNPAPVMRLVEVVTTVLTDSDAADAVRDLAERCGKSPVVVGDRAGFVANALLFGYLNQAARMVEIRHASVADVDAAVTAAVGLPMGPLTLMDLIGLDVCLEVIDVMYDETRDQRYAASSLLRRLVMARHLGRKTGAGYYSYDGDVHPAVGDVAEKPDAGPVQDATPPAGCTVAVVAADPDAAEAVDVAKAFNAAADAGTADLLVHVPRAPVPDAVVELAARTATGQAALAWAKRVLSDLGRSAVTCRPRPGFIVEALLFPHVNDAARMVDDGYATTADVDTAMRLGCGYPRGPFELLAAVGADAVVAGLPAIAAEAPTPAMVTAALLRAEAGQ